MSLLGRFVVRWLAWPTPSLNPCQDLLHQPADTDAVLVQVVKLHPVVLEIGVAMACYEETEFDGFIVLFRSKTFHEIQELYIGIVTRIL